jgi:hypothetical protein
MPRIGDFNPNQPFNPVIQNSPGPISAPNLPDTGGAVSESIIHGQEGITNDLEHSSSAVRSGLTNVFSGAMDVVRNIKQHKAVKNQMNQLTNTNSAGAAADNLVGNFNNTLSDYTNKNLNNVDAYSPDAIAQFMAPLDAGIAQARSNLVSNLQPTKTGGIEATNVFDNAMRDYKNSLSKSLNEAKHSAMIRQVEGNDLNLMDGVNTQAATDLQGAINRLDSPEAKAIMVPAGTYIKLEARKDQAKMSNFAALNANLLNSGKFLKEAGGDLIARSVAQQAAFKDFENTFNTSKLYQDLPPTIREKMQSQLDTTKNALHSQKEQDIKTANLQKEYIVDGLAMQAASDDPSTRANAINKLSGMLSAEDKIPPEYRSESIANKIVSAAKSVSYVQAARAANVQAVEIGNKNLEQQTIVQNQAVQYKSPEAVKAQIELNRTINSYNNIVKAARASVPNGQGNKHVFVPNTGITVDNMGELKQKLENAKSIIDPSKIVEFDKMIHSLTEQTVPNFMPIPQKQDSIFGLGAHTHITEDHEYTDIKTKPLDPNFAAAILGKVTGIDAHSSEYMQLQNAVNKRIDELRNDPVVKSNNPSAETIRNTAYMEILKSKHPILMHETPRKAEPAKFPKKDTDTLMKQGKFTWPTKETDKAQGR